MDQQNVVMIIHPNLKTAHNRFTDEDIRNNYPSFVLFPQYPHGNQWMNARRFITSSVIDLLPTPTITTQLLLNLIDDLTRSYPVDASRFYLAGISMGGFGVWDIISRLPEKFAAAVPVCGGDDTKFADKIKLSLFHCGLLTVIPMILFQQNYRK